MLVEFYGLSVRTPLDPRLPLTSLMYRLPGCLLLMIQNTFAGLQCGSLTFIFVIRLFRLYWCYAPLGLASCVWYWLFVVLFWFCVYEAFVLSGLGICVLCVKLVSAGPIKGRLDFFFFKKNVRCVYKKWMDDAFKGEWMCDAFIRWMDDALKMSECTMRFMKWMDDAF